jgi:hypothetical protein
MMENLKLRNRQSRFHCIGFLNFVIHVSILNKTRHGNWTHFYTQMRKRGNTTQPGPTEETNLNLWSRMETDAGSKHHTQKY